MQEYIHIERENSLQPGSLRDEIFCCKHNENHI